MKLGELLEGLEHYELLGNREQEISGVAYDSRLVNRGSLFVALRGHKEDGHCYIESAVQRGAAAVVTEHVQQSIEGVTQVRVSDSRKALSKVALRFYRNPCEGLSLIGITGTNGKTTTSFLLESVLKASGGRPGILGTVGYRFAGKVCPASVTTPESLDIMRLVRGMLDQGATHIILEVSSHALDQGRTQDCSFNVAVFTNLSRDHLDYHVSMEEYFKAKSRLFTTLPEGHEADNARAVINLDDPRGEDLLTMTSARVLTYGLKKTCDVRARSLQSDGRGLKFRLETPAGERKIHSALLGDFNIYNIMAAAAASLALGLSLDAVVEGVEALERVPGRMEPVKNGAGLTLVVDYAHTPDALLKSLHALKPQVAGRIITVFGCGGDRDRGKRFDMGLVAGRKSDLVFITSDNPRSEEPASIVEEVEKGVIEAGLEKKEWVLHVQPERGVYFTEVDRREAIRKAVCLARGDDLVLIAGKGHEDYQIIGSEKRPFSDQAEAAAAAVNRA
ncbi:MAG: UDP-N-acetylmuramoyl-L-alanyl-D-glutamate--2,6-diaminopimelate ligase [Deltaproteobacteria bacterium]|nr:UDP-N-acetylmuramoyl-L-alanyl-D-glutamate--2,6-diaminopimelate ligase [Deltaproteobacteria bacterium]